jgi:AraC family transcriptional regulator
VNAYPVHAGSSWSFSVPGFSILMGEHEPSSVLERHTHDSPTICAVERGSFTEYYPGKAVPCDARTVKVTPAGEPHWNRFDGAGTRGVRIDVDAPRFETEPSLSRMLGERLFFPAEPFTPLTRSLLAELTSPDQFSRISVEALLLELLAAMGRLGSAQAPVARRSWVVRADDMIRALYRSPLSVTDVAAEVGVQPATLARAYRRTYGCSVGERIRVLRLDHAAMQLAESDVAIASIALDAGFYDQSHFTNAFRAHFGTTPARYRRWTADATTRTGRRRA